ncbi:hypothetical protein TrRE_jg4692 [Triparma retinervis]|uniref:Uncharacterized protein n=1 Tax=Triparma retinervis TaxID=2557542 RepID=A0A9W7FAB6_9STRA|nr:hypothetical protein TrRE_jg4692 [Triparma retinervis]
MGDAECKDMIRILEDINEEEEEEEEEEMESKEDDNILDDNNLDDNIPDDPNYHSLTWSRPRSSLLLEYYALYTSVPNTGRPKSALVVSHPWYLTGLSPCRMGHESMVRAMEAVRDTDVMMVCPTMCGRGGSEPCGGGEEGTWEEDVVNMLIGMGVEDVVTVGPCWYVPPFGVEYKF